MKIKYQKQWWLLFFALFLQTAIVYSQVKFTIEKLQDSQTYQVYMLPEVTWLPPRKLLVLPLDREEPNLPDEFPFELPGFPFELPLLPLFPDFPFERGH